MKWSKYNFLYRSEKHGYLLFNMLSGAFLDINEPKTRDIILKIQDSPANYDFSDDKELLDILINYGVLCVSDDSVNENKALFQTLHQRFNEDIRTLVIMPTLNCNLRCSYCFVGENLKHVEMSDEIIQRLKNYLKEEYSGKVKFINVEWYGGEPLLCFQTIKDLTEYIKSLDIPFRAGIITNGTLLTCDKILQLKELCISEIQITIDGTRTTHDTRRMFPNKNGTYDIILHNLELLHKYVEDNTELIINIRLNIDKYNQAEYHIIYNELRKKFPLFNLYPGILTQYQTCISLINCFENQEEVAEFLLDQYDKYGIDSGGFYPMLKGNRPCMSECVNTDMIGPNGEMYLCLKDVGDEKEIIGNIFTGKSNTSKLARYCVENIKQLHKEPCLSCQVKWLCGGGCPNHLYRKQQYGEKHDVCIPLRNKKILQKYLDLHYEFKQKI